MAGLPGRQRPSALTHGTAPVEHGECPTGTIKYEQALLDISDEIDLDRDRVRYEADRAKDIELTGAHGIDSAIAEHDLDALLSPMVRGANVSAHFTARHALTGA